ncbi:MAG: zinc-ribbon domain-containing protein [Vicinamibacteria bacterium]|nr:zinc-ribbon domain-containing protein [Vicinamibacteria bacterium]
MIIVCPSCQSRYRFDETKLGNRPRARTRCGKCGASIEIENPLTGSATLPPEDYAPPPAPAPPEPPAPAVDERQKTQRQITPPPLEGGQTITGQDLHKMGLLELPKDKRFSIAVIQGPATGQIFQISKTRTTIGRSGCDVNLNDPEASRQHAVIEIFGERVILRDLGSTNGTYIDMERIEHAQLSNHMEFRVGGHTLMLIVTEVE